MFNQWASLISEISLQLESIPKDFYSAKRLVSKLRLNEVKIDYYLKSYMLSYTNDAALTHCKFYGEPRFKPKKGGSVAYKDVSHKRIHYLPLIPRLKRLYVSMSLALHSGTLRTEGVMVQ